MELQTIPRTYVNGALQAARLPLTAVELAAHRQDDETWAPALAFDSFDATTRQLLGSLLRDEVLVQQGRIRQARVAEIRDAVRLAATADQAKAEADQSLQSRISSDRSRKQENADRAAERKAEADRKREDAKGAADKQSRQRAEEAKRAEQDRMKALDKKERTARTDAIAKERAVVSKAKKAAGAKAGAMAADKKLRTSKNARRSA